MLGVREPPHRQQSHAQCEHGGQQHQDRQQGRSIDDHEDDEDRDERDQQQESVDAEEALDEIGGESRRTGHPCLEAVGNLRLNQSAQLLDDRRGLARRVDRHEDLHRLAVLGRDGRRDAVQNAGDLGDVIREGLQIRELLIIERIVAGDHHHGRDAVGRRGSRAGAR